MLRKKSTVLAIGLCFAILLSGCSSVERQKKESQKINLEEVVLYGHKISMDLSAADPQTTAYIKNMIARAEGGDKNARLNLIMAVFSGSPFLPGGANRIAALEMLKKAAEDGNNIAATNLGAMYAGYSGFSEIPISRKESIKYYKMAADMGDHSAMLNYAYFLGCETYIENSGAIGVRKASDPDQVLRGFKAMKEFVEKISPSARPFLGENEINCYAHPDVE